MSRATRSSRLLYNLKQQVRSILDEVQTMDPSKLPIKRKVGNDFMGSVESCENSLQKNLSFRVEPLSLTYTEDFHVKLLKRESQQFDENFYSKIPFRAQPHPHLHERVLVGNFRNFRHGPLAL